MIAAKRRRDGSITATPTVSHLSRNHPDSSLPSSHIHPANHHHHLSSVAASAGDAARAIEIEGEYEEDSDPDEVVMCVDMKGQGTVGCCYYESSTSSLHFIEDFQCGGLEVIECCAYTFADYFCTV